MCNRISGKMLNIPRLPDLDFSHTIVNATVLLPFSLNAKTLAFAPDTANAKIDSVEQDGQGITLSGLILSGWQHFSGQDIPSNYEKMIQSEIIDTIRKRLDPNDPGNTTIKPLYHLKDLVPAGKVVNLNIQLMQVSTKNNQLLFEASASGDAPRSFIDPYAKSLLGLEP